MGIISAGTAFILYAVIAALTWFTLDGDYRYYVLLAIGLFAFKTYIDIVRRRLQAREDAERQQQQQEQPLAAAPTSDVTSGHDA